MFSKARNITRLRTHHTSSQLSLTTHPDRYLVLSKCVRNFSPFPASSRPHGWRRRRFYRRITIFGIAFAAWFFYIDADFITYALDLYRQKYHSFKSLQVSRDPNDFSNKTIWIVGASSGIGEYLTYHLCSLQKGAPNRIIISARREQELIRVANECNNIDPKIEILVKPLDITQFSRDSNGEFGEQYINEVMTEIDDDIDIVVLNSGMIQKCRAEYASMDTFKELAEINMFGPVGFAQSMVKQWRFKGYTKHKKLHQIAVTSSFVGKVGSPGYAFYSLTKHGINGFFESLRIELQDENIGINLMCLGPLLPSKGTHAEMGGNRDVQYVRKYTDKYGNVLGLDRCAELYVTALSNNLSESWITVNPYLFYMYSRQYLPAVALPLTKVFAKPFLREVQKADKHY